MLNTMQKTALLYVVTIMIHFFLNNPLSCIGCDLERGNKIDRDGANVSRGMPQRNTDNGLDSRMSLLCENKNELIARIVSLFLVACTRLYKSLCPLVGLLVTQLLFCVFMHF